MPENTVNTLINMIDSHIATQIDLSTRPSSQGTMFVDYDEFTVVPIVTYRQPRGHLKREDSRGTMFVDFGEDSVEPLVTWRNSKRAEGRETVGTREDAGHLRSESRSRASPQDARKDSRAEGKAEKSIGSVHKTFSVSYSASTHSCSNRPQREDISSSQVVGKNLEVPPHRECNRGLYIEGYDPETEYSFDYDGVMLHVHREAARPESCVSEYYEMDTKRLLEAYKVKVPEAARARGQRHNRKKTAPQIHGHHGRGRDQDRSQAHSRSHRNQGQSQHKDQDRNVFYIPIHIGDERLPAPAHSKSKHRKVVTFVERLFHKLADCLERLKNGVTSKDMIKIQESWVQNGYVT